MALTPEEILSKRFQTTKFRDGYDQDEVDDFLDEVVLEVRRLIAENADLRAAQGAKSGQVEKVEVPEYPVAPEPVSGASVETTDASRSIIELAQKLHADHVRDGQLKRDKLVREGQEQAARMVRDAEAQAREVLGQLEINRRAVEQTIEELKHFESDYRGRLRDYIEDQLETLIREDGYQAEAEAQNAVTGSFTTVPEPVAAAVELDEKLEELEDELADTAAEGEERK
jgi:DivIVA domain-containing protein